MDSLVEYETVVDPVETGAGDITDTAPADTVADTVDTAAEDTVQETQANPFEGIDLDVLRALSEIAPHFLNAGYAAAPQQQLDEQLQQTGPPDLDPFDPESVRAYNDWRDQQILSQIGQMVAPLHERAQQAAQIEQHELLTDAARDVEVRKGEFLGDDDARGFARDLMLQQARTLAPEFFARYGQTDRAAELALEAAHGQVRSYQDAIAKAAVEQHVNRNARLAGQHGEPGHGSGSGVQVAEDITAANYRPGMIAQKYASNANALRTG